MERQQTLLAKYRALVSEWNAISITCSILFGFSILGLIFGLIFSNLIVVVVTVVLMFVFGIFEHRSRKDYVDAKTHIEEEMFKLAGMRRPKTKEIIKKGLWG